MKNAIEEQFQRDYNLVKNLIQYALNEQNYNENKKYKLSEIKKLENNPEFKKK